MQAEGSSRALSDDIPEITRCISWSVMVVGRDPVAGGILYEPDVSRKSRNRPPRTRSEWRWDEESEGVG